MGRRCVDSERGEAGGRKVTGTEGCDCAGRSRSSDWRREQARGSAGSPSWAARRGCRVRMGGGGRQPRAPVFPAKLPPGHLPAVLTVTCAPPAVFSSLLPPVLRLQRTHVKGQT